VTSRGIHIALLASLLGNVFACGAIGGGLWMLDRQRSPQPNSVQGRPIRSAGQALPPADRLRFEEKIRQVLLDGRDLQRTAVSSRRNAAALFTQRNFDKAAVSNLLEQARMANVTLQSQIDNAAIDFAATLPVDERANLALGLERGGPLRHPAP
jgi:uncharacterized membrane protein